MYRTVLCVDLLLSPWPSALPRAFSHVLSPSRNFDDGQARKLGCVLTALNEGTKLVNWSVEHDDCRAPGRRRDATSALFASEGVKLASTERSPSSTERRSKSQHPAGACPLSFLQPMMNSSIPTFAPAWAPQDQCVQALQATPRDELAHSCQRTARDWKRGGKAIVQRSMESSLRLEQEWKGAQDSGPASFSPCTSSKLKSSRASEVSSVEFSDSWTKRSRNTFSGQSHCGLKDSPAGSRSPFNRVRLEGASLGNVRKRPLIAAMNSHPSSGLRLGQAAGKQTKLEPLLELW